MKNRLSKYIFILSCFSIVGISSLSPRWMKEGPNSTISWDVDGYYSYLPAFLIFGDPAGLKYYDDILEKYLPTYIGGSFFRHVNGNYIMKYSAGMAIMYLPGFSAAHIFALLTEFPADGYSLPYQIGLHFWSMIVAMIGLWYCRKNLLRFFNDSLTAIALVLIVFSTNYLNYSTFDAAMSHNYLFTLYALLIHFTIGWYEKPDIRKSFGIGLCCGLATLARPSEIISILIPVFWGMGSVSSISERWNFWKKSFPEVITIVLTIGLIGSIQLIYWKIYGGEWTVYSYQNQGFSWFFPHFGDVLFSYQKGWFIYTPLMLFALAGFFQLFRKQRKLFWGILLFFLINTWVVSSWDVWWYGGGLGQRAMIQSYALLIFPLAAFIQFGLKRGWLKWFFMPVFAFCLFLNCFQTWQAHWGGFNTEEMSKAYFWRIFLNTNVTENDKLLLDTPEDFRGERIKLKEIYSSDFENLTDSVFITFEAHSGIQALFMNGQREFSTDLNIPAKMEWKNYDWLRVSGWFFSPRYPPFQGWEMTRLVVRFEHKGKTVKERNINPQRLLKKGEWKEVGTEMRIPKEYFDNIKVFLWNPDNDKAFIMDDLKMEVFMEGA